MVACIVFALSALWLAACQARPQQVQEGITNTTGTSHQSGGDEYVVLFDNSRPHVAEVLSRINLTVDHSDVRHTFNNSAFRGFTAKMKSHCIGALSEMGDVAAVEKTVQTSSFATAARVDAPWGLERISSSRAGLKGSAGAMKFTYSFEAEGARLGGGVDVYVVDTGVRVDHAAFGGRARLGFSFQPDGRDGDGHGTHCAGTAAGSTFGVASAANVIAVKVLGPDGSGLTSDTLAGMDYIVRQHDARAAQPGFVGSVMSMSWGLQATSDAISHAIGAATAAGVHVAVAAGNSAGDSCAFAPASAGGAAGPAVSVGSVGIAGRISAFSNTGACVDLYAPGESVLSAWPDSAQAVNTLSGTSMACPHVTGVMAYLMARNASLAASPARMKQFLRDSALRGVLTGSARPGDAKLLLNNGITGPATTSAVEATAIQADAADAAVQLRY